MRRSLRRRLVVAFVAVTLVAVVAIALEVVPTLESSLAQARLRALADDTRVVLDGADTGTQARERRLVEQVAVRTGGAVVVLEPGARGMAVRRRTSARAAGAPPEVLRLAARARAQDATVRDVAGGDELVARVATPVPPVRRGGPGGVLVVTESLQDVRATVTLVRRRVLLGGLLGLAVALVTGAAYAYGLSTRLRRLEQGSRAVAAGRFTTRFPVEAQDELGSLARSLDTMQRQLAELDDGRKRFIATASHELRTPLQSLSGFVELLRDEELTEDERREFLDRLAVQVERLTRLSFDLLDLSRLESGGLDLRPEDTDLHDLAERVAGEFAPVVERDGRALRVRLIGPRVVQRVDPDRVEQVVRILVDNALKHGGPRATVELRVERAQGAGRIAVHDEGPGIPPERLAQVFAPFHGTGDGSGAGLGLAIARELAHRMRGELRVESGPGGTTFTLELPR